MLDVRPTKVGHTTFSWTDQLLLVNPKKGKGKTKQVKPKTVLTTQIWPGQLHLRGLFISGV